METLVVLVASALSLTACQSPALLYQAQFQTPSRKVALHAPHIRSPKAATSDSVSSREADRSTVRSVRGQSASGPRGFSSEDEARANDPQLESPNSQSHTFESAVVGSDQWYRERAEDQAKEMELRHKLRICAC
jgi:hypothetical protein